MHEYMNVQKVILANSADVLRNVHLHFQGNNDLRSEFAVGLI